MKIYVNLDEISNYNLYFSPKMKLKLKHALLRDAPSEQANREEVLRMITRDGGNMRYAAAFKDDEQLMLEALRNSSKLKSERSWEILAFASPRLRDNEDFIFAIIKTHCCWLSLQFASKRLRGNYKICLAAVLQDSWALKWCENSLKDNVEFIVSASFADARVCEWANDCFWK